MAQDRPSAVELLDAVREFLERDVIPATEGRVAFHVRVAVNVVGIVGRELEHGPELDAAEHARLRELLGHDGGLRELDAELASRIRDGSLDDRRAEVLDHVRETVRAKLVVANPKYLRPDKSRDAAEAWAEPGRPERNRPGQARG